jgi:hypothetical protein
VKLQIGKPTHQAVWNCLEFWAKQKKSGNLFSRVIGPYGRSLDEWLAPLGGGRMVAPQAYAWLSQWGFDLRILADDRDARNVSSYRPDGIPNAWQVEASGTLEFAEQVWAAFEPTRISSFGVIDGHILRLASETLFKGRTGVEASTNVAQFRSWISTALSYEGLSKEAEERWKRFLTRQVDFDDACLFRFSREASEDERTSHLGIISRAALLLRIATGSTADLVRSASFSAESISFWWEAMGQARGLWEGTRDRESLLDLWADIVPFLQDLGTFRQKHPGPQQTFFRAGSELGDALIGLGSCERVALWSITPSP